MLFRSRVRENPGGNSSLANFWDAEEATDFKPTRRYVTISRFVDRCLIYEIRVRQGPGGHDSINDVSNDDSAHFLRRLSSGLDFLNELLFSG